MSVETLWSSRRTRSQNEKRRLSPKIDSLAGSLQPERKRCGKPICRCARGELHGPYWRRYWREGGRRHRAYVRTADVERTRAGLAEWRRLHPPARSARELLAELRRLFREIERGEV